MSWPQALFAVLISVVVLGIFFWSNSDDSSMADDKAVFGCADADANNFLPAAIDDGLCDYDFDDDGINDVDDPDVDGDGVMNQSDECTFTVLGDVVNAAGCSRQQIPRVSLWQKRVPQHWDVNDAEWKTDPAGITSENVSATSALDTCQEWYSGIISVELMPDKEIITFYTAGNANTVLSQTGLDVWECVNENGKWIANDENHSSGANDSHTGSAGNNSNAISNDANTTVIETNSNGTTIETGAQNTEATQAQASNLSLLIVGGSTASLLVLVKLAWSFRSTMKDMDEEGEDPGWDF